MRVLSFFLNAWFLFVRWFSGGSPCCGVVCIFLAQDCGSGLRIPAQEVLFLREMPKMSLQKDSQNRGLNLLY